MFHLIPLRLISLLMVFCLGACEKTKDALGISRHQPDEFRVMTRPLLKTPLTTTLNQPQQGEGQPYIPYPHQAREALGVQTQTAQGPSSAEKTLIQKAKAGQINQDKTTQNIRQQLAADQKQTGKDQPDAWAQKVFYWQKNAHEKGQALDPHQEYKRLKGHKHPTDSNIPSKDQ